MKIGIIGIGFVGGAIYHSLKQKVHCVIYDKYKNLGTFEQCLKTDMLFLCLPTIFCKENNEYDKSAIFEICQKLDESKYEGLVILKSTIEPTTTNSLQERYESLKIIHNPEFLSAKTAFDDFENQEHIVIGLSNTVSQYDVEILKNMYSLYYPDAVISICCSNESESMKIFCNAFYAVKIQFFTELYILCKKLGFNFETIKKLMLKNDWINPMHTNVPGSDGMVSYGGYCFPKDTNALLAFMQANDTPSFVLQSTVEERNKLRPD